MCFRNHFHQAARSTIMSRWSRITNLSLSISPQRRKTSLFSEIFHLPCISTYTHSWRIDHRQHHISILTAPGAFVTVRVLLHIEVPSNYFRRRFSTYFAKNDGRHISGKNSYTIVLLFAFLNHPISFREDP